MLQYFQHVVVVPVKIPPMKCLKSISVAYIYILDTYRRNDNWRMIKTQEGRRKKTSLEKYSPLTLLQGFERVVLGLHVRGCWRPNINFTFWPHCYDRHVVSCSPDVLLHQGFPRAPLGRVWLSLPHLVSNSLEVYWQLLGTPNSSQLYNNSTPTRSPTGSLKSNV